MIYDVNVFCLLLFIFLISVRREGALGHSGAELSSPEAVGAVRHSVHRQGCPSGLSGGTHPPETRRRDVG